MGKSALSRDERLKQARAILHAVTPMAEGVRGAVRPVSQPDLVRFDEVIPQPLRDNGIVAITGAVSVALAALSEVMCHDRKQSRWAAVLGAPELSMQAASEQGINLDRLVVIPQLRGRVDEIVAAVIDGIDVVMCGPQVDLAQDQQRRIAARVRRNGRFLLSMRPWVGADLTVRVRQRQWQGTEVGHGWLRQVEAQIERTGRGAFVRPAQGNVALMGRAAG